MNIKQFKRSSKKIDNFRAQEWKIADEEHYGRDSGWKTEKINLKAIEKGEILGIVMIEMEAGVAHIRSVQVSHKRRGEGIGKMMMFEAERIAKQKGAHKMYLDTGKSWIARKLYESCGFTVTTELPDHYLHHDFVLYTKFI